MLSHETVALSARNLLGPKCLLSLMLIEEMESPHFPPSIASAILAYFTIPKELIQPTNLVEYRMTINESSSYFHKRLQAGSSILEPGITLRDFIKYQHVQFPVRTITVIDPDTVKVQNFSPESEPVIYYKDAINEAGISLPVTNLIQLILGKEINLVWKE